MGITGNEGVENNPTMNKNASDVALEWVKQIITLSSGIVALSATFVEKLGNYPTWIVLFLIISWLCLITSVITGLTTISAIVQSHLENNNDWSVDTGKRNALACKFLFIIGVVVFCLFALLTLFFQETKTIVAFCNSMI